MEELSYDGLRKIQARERASPVLQSIPDGFYALIKKLIEKKNEGLKSSFSLTEAKEYESILKVAEDIHERRMQKIVLRAMKAGAGQEEMALTGEEAEIFERISRAVSEDREKFNSMIVDKGSKESEERIKRIKILKNLPKFVGTDLKVYGPFKEGDSAELPEKEAQLLVSRGIAEQIGGVSNEVSK
ncbi:DNA replication complex GINS family protein [Candidatus Micrarchaeota archaeon]|nr:DNA replication complex GINS family protein [Candidatus Micrarchaeota archaeon]